MITDLDILSTRRNIAAINKRIVSITSIFNKIIYLVLFNVCLIIVLITLTVFTYPHIFSSILYIISIIMLLITLIKLYDMYKEAKYVLNSNKQQLKLFTIQLDSFYAVDVFQPRTEFDDLIEN